MRIWILSRRFIGKASVLHAPLVVVHQIVEFLRGPHGGVSLYGINLVVTPNIDSRSLTINELLHKKITKLNKVCVNWHFEFS